MYTLKPASFKLTHSPKDDRIELSQTIHFPFTLPQAAKGSANPPAIGPPPDGSDRSINFAGGFPSGFPIVLRRAQR